MMPRPFAGQIVDRENNKGLLFAVLARCVISSGILVAAGSPVYLLLSRSIYGLCWGVGFTLCMTCACNSLSEDVMMRGISIDVMIVPVGLACLFVFF